MAPFRGWAILPRIGTGTRYDAYRPDMRGVAAPGDRMECIGSEDTPEFIVAVDIADDARLAAGRVICEHENMPADKMVMLARMGRSMRGFERFHPLLHLVESPAPPSGSFVFDSFTDTATTELSTHVGETGATWTKHPSIGSALCLINSSGRLYSTDAVDFSGQDAWYYPSGTPASADYTVECPAFFPVGGGGINCEVEVWVRLLTSAVTGYFVSMERNGIASTGTGSMTMYRVSAGAYSSLGTYAPTLTDNATNTLTLEIVGSAQKAYFNGVQRITGSNTDLSAAGVPGLQQRNTTNGALGGLQPESFTATDASSTTPTPGGAICAGVGPTARVAAVVGGGVAGGVAPAEVIGAVSTAKPRITIVRQAVKHGASW